MLQVKMFWRNLINLTSSLINLATRGMRWASFAAKSRGFAAALINCHRTLDLSQTSVQVQTILQALYFNLICVDIDFWKSEWSCKTKQGWENARMHILNRARSQSPFWSIDHRWLLSVVKLSEVVSSYTLFSWLGVRERYQSLLWGSKCTITTTQ